ARPSSIRPNMTALYSGWDGPCALTLTGVVRFFGGVYAVFLRTLDFGMVGTLSPHALSLVSDRHPCRPQPSLAVYPHVNVTTADDDPDPGGARWASLRPGRPTSSCAPSASCWSPQASSYCSAWATRSTSPT